MSAHSPGPWLILIPEALAGKDAATVVAHSDGHGVALVTSLADARLIAGAPELLEMVKKLEADASLCTSTCDGCVRQRALALIRRIEAGR